MTSLDIVEGNIDEHSEAVESQHRFEPIEVGDETWDFSHLEAFAIKIPIDANNKTQIVIDVVFFFTCHCFTRSLETGETPESGFLFDNGQEKRVLDKERYELSKVHLRDIVKTLPSRSILVASPSIPNFVTYEIITSSGETKKYSVFFMAQRDKKRKKRVLLRIQSAYVLENETKRQASASKISFRNLIKRAYL
jgi:hypothetical protein